MAKIKAIRVDNVEINIELRKYAITTSLDNTKLKGSTVGFLGISVGGYDRISVAVLNAVTTVKNNGKRVQRVSMVKINIKPM